MFHALADSPPGSAGVRYFQVTGAIASTSGTSFGDPHMTNILGQKFDVVERGAHVLIQVPRFAGPKDTLLRVEANVSGGMSCEYAFIQGVTVTGKWAEAVEAHKPGGLKPDGIQFTALPWGNAGRSGRNSPRLHVGPVTLKISYAMMESGLTYFNFRADHLRDINVTVGGLLGVDDHAQAASKEKCLHDLAAIRGHPNMSSADEIEAGSSTASA